MRYFVAIISGLLVTKFAVAICTFDLGNDTTICSQGTHLLDPGVILSAQGDSLVITYNATQGQSGLQGAAKVYMHSNYELVPFGGPVGSWVGNWGQDDGLGEMTSIGTDLWQITIHPASYYGYHPDTTINGLFMVFRNADGTAEGKDDSGNDIFLDMTIDPPVSLFGGITSSWQRWPCVSITWSDGSSDLTLEVNSAGEYWAAVIDTGGNIFRDTVNVVFGNIPFVDIGNDTAFCNTVQLTLDAGPGYPSYVWSTGATTQSINVTSIGQYSITVTDSLGCSGFDIINVSQGSAPNVDLGNDTLVCGDLDIVIDAGAGFQNYAWSSGENTQTILVTTGGDYQVTVSDASGCSTSDSITIASGNIPMVSLGGDTALCEVNSIVLDAGAGFTTYQWSNGETGQTISVDNSGDYSVKVTNADGCESSDTVNIGVGIDPVANFGYANLGNFVIQFIDSSINAESYSWDFRGNGRPDDNTAGDKTYTYLYQGIFNVQLIVSNDCGADTILRLVIVDEVGIEQHSLVDDLQIYPNPSQGNFVLSLETSSDVISDMTLYDFTGNKLFQDQLKRWTSDRFAKEYDFSHLNEGVYLIKINTEGHIITRTILIQ